MFERIRTWLTKSSGLREAARDAAREATREGLTEGYRLGVEDFLLDITGERAIEPRPVKTITSNGNGHHEREPIHASQLRDMRKAELLEMAESRGIEADETLTVADLKARLVAS